MKFIIFTNLGHLSYKQIFSLFYAKINHKVVYLSLEMVLWVNLWEFRIFDIIELFAQYSCYAIIFYSL
ncbi:hypothetical protein BmHG_00182 [Borrelia miyamotoi]|nr:hypothetical protein BmHH_00179 [Borrelia miyamotoi]BCR09418.1 hypothetical protein BmHG_00182 [Borrelia miyamotoi]BCR11076.1 hypothetical protein BmHI_00180 [Borrelia miyamotoi]BCR11904.1 hypothetical protein BmHA_00179 [Borrelia miyamotoi]BCR13326.1 hypothetical protein BmHB_00181 [Borrelia miyamotoi]